MDGKLHIGRVIKSYGSRGEVLISLRDITIDDLDISEPVYAVFDGLPVPFFFRCIKGKGASRILAEFYDVVSTADADELAGKDLYADYLELEGDDGMPDLIGWTLKDAEGVTVGTITGIEDIPGNPCLCLDTSSGEVLIPLHEDLIISEDLDAKVLTMTVPEGLLS